MDSRDIDAATASISAMLRQISDENTSLYTHTIKHLHDIDEIVAPSTSHNEFCRYVEAKYSKQLNAKRLFRVRHFLTIVRRPPLLERGVLGTLGNLVASLQGQDKDAENVLKSRNKEALALETICSQAEQYCASHRPRRLRTTDPTLWSMLGFLINGTWQQIPPAIMALDKHLPHCRVSFERELMRYEGADPRDTKVAAMLGILTYGDQTSADMFDSVIGLNTEFVLTQNFTPLNEKKARDTARGTRIQMQQAEDEAVSLSQELHRLSDHIASRRTILGRHHISLQILAPPGSISDNLSSAISALAPSGLKVKREDLGIEPAFWAQLPGNFNYQTRANHAVITDRNFADFSAFHAFDAGETRDLTWDKPICVFVSTSRTAYNFNFHNPGKNANGTFAIYGPSGTGKTALCNFLLSQSQKLPVPPRIIYFDKDYGSRIFVDAMEGQYNILKAGEKTSFNPLQVCKTPEDAAWLGGFIERLSGLDLNDEQRLRLNEASLRNANIEPQHRTFKEFISLLSSLDDEGQLTSSLREWHGRGDKAWLFDNPDDSFQIDKGLTALDMTSLLKDPRVRSASLDYIFFRIEKILRDGYPTIILLEEAWKLLSDDRFQARTQDWIKTIRKLNGILGFLTQEPGDATNSKICDTLISNTATQIFLANPKADTASYIDAFRLTSVEYQLVTKMREAQRLALIKKGQGSTLVQMVFDDKPMLSVLSGTAISTKQAEELKAANIPDWLDKFMNNALSNWRTAQ